MSAPAEMLPFDRGALAPLPWAGASAPGLTFPYMEWAHHASARTRSPLSNSGVPNADSNCFADLRVDLDHPSRSALPEFEAAIARRIGVAPEAVVATPGASGGLAAVALWLFTGARVAVETPSYEQLRSLALRFAGQAIPLPRRHAQGYDCLPSDLDQALMSAKRQGGPGHAFLTNTHNPSGAKLPASRLRELADSCARHGGALVSCDIYQEFLPASERVWACRAADNGITIGSLTKAYGLGPLRLGWVALGEALVERRHELRDATYLLWVDPPTTTLAAGVVALQHLEQLGAKARELQLRSKPILDHWLRTEANIEAFVPEHGLVSFPRVRGISDTRALAEELVRQAEVDVVPGEFFGAPGHLRVSCGLPPIELESALERLTDVLARQVASLGANR
jgi:aspartate/methionine/tyrosine aminotransferase